MELKYDFSGWATKNDLKCSDGRTIRKDAFKDNDGQTVPLVWQHRHDDPINVLGHALLENRDEGVYAYCTFNDTDMGKHVKALVQHGDVTALSIYANGLKQHGGDVLHGAIKEVSVVLAGANPGAFIQNVAMVHADGSDGYDFIEDEATIFTGEDIDLCHADDKEDGAKEKEEGAKKVATDNKERTVKDVFDEFTEEQKKVVYFMIGQALEDAKNGGADDEGEDEEMKHNVFDTETGSKNVLSHSDFVSMVDDAKRNGGSLKAAVESFMEANSLSHDDLAGDVVFSGGEQEYFVDDPDFLFPEARALNNPPAWIKRDTGWVGKILNGAHTARLLALSLSLRI